MTEDGSDLEVRREPPLAWICVNRSEARNAMTTEMWGEMAGLVRDLAEDGEIRVIVLRGEGGTSFISGADIAELKRLHDDPEAGRVNSRFTAELLDAITLTAKPVIAMINGHCFGGGVLIAMACDLRFASDSAQFGIPAVKLGLAYPIEHGVGRLVRTVGPTHAADLLLSGRTISAAEACRFGLINQTAPAAELEGFTRDYATQLAGVAPLSIAAHKYALRHIHGKDSSNDIRGAFDLAEKCYLSNDFEEGMRAFLEKRKPVFKGD